MPELGNVTAVILAGGLGTRLRSVVADRPKVLATVAGRPYLTHLLDQLDGAGIRSVVLCTGYLGEQVNATVGPRYGRLSMTYSQESEPLGTGGALRLALPQVHSSHVLVLNGDSYCDADLPAFWAWHVEHRSSASLLLTRVADTRRFGRVTLASAGRIQHFEEKGATEGAGLINAGIYLLSRALLAALPADRPVSLEREAFPTWPLHGYPTEAAFLDIGTPETYVVADAFFGQLDRRAA
jgi:D-glycero-alpha-D-manno-heptose 1-phosphate guanylyltransferase